MEVNRARGRAWAISAFDGNKKPSVRVSVVIPALNEAENLPFVLAQLPDGLHELILVDGGSSDGTVEVARSVYPDARVIEQAGAGKGDALACGFAVATGDVVVTLDADGSTDPREIPRFVAALELGADYAKGSRFLAGGGSDDLTWLRKVGNWALTRLVNLLFGTRYSDLCYGYNAFRTELGKSLAKGANGFEVETAMNLRAARAELSVVEVPSREAARIHGQSNLRTFRDGWRVLVTILSTRFGKSS